MGDTLIAALVGGGASLVVALLGHWLGPRGQRAIQKDVEELKAALGERASAAAARRDYEYEARKRLYSQVEPLLFQLYEALEEAHYRVRSLVRSATQGYLGRPPSNWLADGGYYLQSTIYKLMLPVACFRLMQRHITFVDLNLDRTIHLRYLLLKLYARSFTDDFVLAATPPRLDYDPNHPEGEHRSLRQPAVYRRQGLVLGDLETVADSLLVKASEGATRVMSFGEFEAVPPEQWNEDGRQELIGLLVDFSPEERPALARMLLAQACLGQLILSTYHGVTRAGDLRPRLDRFISSPDVEPALRWPGDEAGRATLPTAQAYLVERLDWLGSNHSWIETDTTSS